MTQQRRPCACGGYLTADPEHPAAAEAEVRRHRAEPRHAAWATLEQLAGRHVAPEPIGRRAEPRATSELATLRRLA